ncbi:ATP-binding protein [Chondrinema litorale]|uniref:ATP-binding protein n=1 Tax=Chondrinema litorale TaxID=2994555 RepID=UPI002542CB86|nr:ATP-binding protein [Chondrinema litorale]UZR93736.1 ATP-binding protein [Chondrinema litorale]
MINSNTDSVILKIVVFGPESTGKTTLAKQLSSHFGTVWNPEFLRYYVDARELSKPDLMKSKQITITEGELLNIAIGQLASEKAIQENNSGILFYDTCLHTNAIYAEHYYNNVPEGIMRMLSSVNYDFFFLCNTDIEWEYDPQRESAEVRDVLFGKMHTYLKENRLPFSIISGTGENRFNHALSILNSKFPSIVNK